MLITRLGAQRGQQMCRFSPRPELHPASGYRYLPPRRHAAVVRASIGAGVVGDRLFLALAFHEKAVFIGAPGYQIGLDRFGAPKRQAIVVAIAAHRVGVASGDAMASTAMPFCIDTSSPSHLPNMALPKGALLLMT